MRSPLLGPLHLDRRDIRVTIPCLECAHHGVCTIEEQIEDNLVLQIIGISVTVKLELNCSLFSARVVPIPRATWTAERRAKFHATVTAKKEKRERALVA